MMNFLFFVFLARVAIAEPTSASECILIIDNSGFPAIFVHNNQHLRSRPVWQAVNTTTGHFQSDAFIYWSAEDAVWNIGPAPPKDSFDYSAVRRYAFMVRPTNPICPSDGEDLFIHSVDDTAAIRGKAFRALSAEPYTACRPAVGLLSSNGTQYDDPSVSSVTECARKAVIHEPLTSAVSFTNGTCSGFTSDATIEAGLGGTSHSMYCQLKLNQLPGYGIAKLGTSVTRAGIYRSLEDCASAVATSEKAKSEAVSFNRITGECVGFLKMIGLSVEHRGEGWISAYLGPWFTPKADPPQAQTRTGVHMGDVGIAIGSAFGGFSILGLFVGSAMLYRRKFQDNQDDDEDLDKAELSEFMAEPGVILDDKQTQMSSEWTSESLRDSLTQNCEAQDSFFEPDDSP